jgi:hypothetical protein
MEATPLHSALRLLEKFGLRDFGKIENFKSEKSCSINRAI